MRRTRPERAARLAGLRERTRALRARQQANRARHAARRRPERSSRRGRWLLLALLLVLLVALCCGDWRCNEPPPEVAPPVPVEVGPGEPTEPAPVEPDDRIDRRERPGFKAEPAPAPRWLDAFRMQVAARSPRLADCFVGAHRPGTLKWTTSVEPGSGLVSDHTLEPMLLGDELSASERACVYGVLEDPPYALPDEPERTTPSRVGLVIEF